MATPIISFQPGQIVGLEGSNNIPVSSNQAISEWHTDYGVLTAVAALAATWTVRNETRPVVKIWATNGNGQSNILQVAVMGLLPNYWAYHSPVRAKSDILKFKPQSGPTQSRSLNPIQLIYQIGSNSTGEDKFEELLAFYYWHRHGKKFVIQDYSLKPYPRRSLCEASSDMTFTPDGKLGFEWNWEIEESWPYGSV